MKAWQTLFVLSVCAACGPQPVSSTQSLESKNWFDDFQRARDALMPARDRLEIIASLPEFAAQDVHDALTNPYALYYDERSMRAGYQDFHNFAPQGFLFAGSIVGPDEFFAHEKFRFPMGHTGGTHRSDVRSIKVLLLPAADNGRQPVVYRTVSNGADAASGFSYQWIFPIGSFVGELLIITEPATGDEYIFEVRTRVLYESGWAVNAYHPFPTSSHLATVLTEIHRSAQFGDLTAILNHLRNDNTLTLGRLTGEAGNGFFLTRNPFDQVAGVDQLPNLDDRLVKKLLTEYPFISRYGQVWKEQQNSGQLLRSFAPTTTDPFSIIPQNYDGGFIEVNEESCNRCHQDVRRPFGYYSVNRIAYGHNWGSHMIFSFYPFEPREGNGRGSRRPTMRSEFVGAELISRYNSELHTSERYPAEVLNSSRLIGSIISSR